MDKQGNEIIAVCNFCPVRRDGYRIGVPEEGVYKEVFNTDDKRFGGSGIGNKGDLVSDEKPMHGFDNSISFTIPPMSVMFFKRVKNKPKTKSKAKTTTSKPTSAKKAKAE